KLAEAARTAADAGLEDAAEVAVIGKSRCQRNLGQGPLGILELLAGCLNAQVVDVFAHRLAKTPAEFAREGNAVNIHGGSDFEDRQRLGELLAEKLEAGGEPPRLSRFSDAAASPETSGELPEDAVHEGRVEPSFAVETVEPRGQARQISVEKPRLEV